MYYYDFCFFNRNSKVLGIRYNNKDMYFMELNDSGCENTDPNFIGNINPLRYRGYYYDVETNLYYLNSRYYDPETGRFISADTLSILDETMADINGLNLYAYCGNNPIMRIDPTGYMPNWLKWVIGGALFAGAVVLTALTGGALAPVFIGMGISIISGGIMQGAITAATGGNFLKGFQNGAVTYKSPEKQIIKMFGGKNATSIMKAQNTRWINRMVNWGIKVTDIGIDLARPVSLIGRSQFYALEIAATIGYEKVFKIFWPLLLL